ncbi:YjaG family protein [Halomonas sp. MCCC 1A17488]|uniref:YjaG family protein n=1 Tax=Billgrantia sulfidoxydans TaxID=2733484 RepID=A0ABX7W9J4_9GAMM|nr:MULTISPECIES: YjaG family protein [Halomonas]MCE8018321.1 YjaG family protein [Halomonas sp. MCCC 1A17488]MCG3241654.1 YjaG family protein [Halomonas sp. MCCC 1A17488]QPP49314.1 YjaG family protein [Halomonas sp. SS10-MC5]QTP56671.1 YjaG family protein [Halomonas sulfidoxydans]
MSQPKGGFHERLQALSPRRQQVFMAALCERLLPNYALYAQMTGAGNPAGVKAILDLVWEQLSVREARIDFERQAEKLAELEPPADDDSFGARRAVEMVVALTSLLDTLRGESADAVLEVSRISKGGVRAYIELTEGEEDAGRLAKLVREHPLMADENDFQDAVLEAVEGNLDREALRALRRLGRNDGVSNLGLEAG